MSGRAALRTAWRALGGMKRAKRCVEGTSTWQVECPYCEELCGTAMLLLPPGPETYTCEQCGQEFILWGQFK